MSHLTNRLNDLKSRLNAAWSALQLDEVKVKAEVLEARMAASDFWANQANARSVSQDAADLQKEWSEWNEFRQELQDQVDVESMASDESDEVALKDIEVRLTELEEQFSKMEFQMLLSGPYDTRNAIISIHAGAGGTDAMDWTAMLLRMFSRFAENSGWTVEALDESRGEEAGFKSVTIAVRGRFAYGWLRSEAGVHRLVRISPFDAEQMRHTTFALVEVLPEFDEVDEKAIELDPDDLRIDTFLSSGKGGQSVNTTYSAVRVTHLPTGISVSCQNERSQSQNKDTALGILKAKLYRIMVTARASKISDIKGDHKTAAWGNQIRSYVLHPYKMVKDHRTEVETTDTEAVLNGELKPFMEAFLRKDVEERA